MIKANKVMEELKGRDLVLFVADEDEIKPSEVPLANEDIYTQNNRGSQTKKP